MPDPRIPEDTILRTSELANAVEDMREAAAREAKDLWADYREELKALGLKGSEISAEVSQFKAAVAEKRMNFEDRAKADAKSEGKDGYLAIINSPRARARTRGSEPLLTKAAGQAGPEVHGTGAAPVFPVGTSSVENEAAEISTPIPEQQSPQPAARDLTDLETAGQVAPIQPETEAPYVPQPMPGIESFADRIKKLRPLCQQPDRCRSSGGKNHCFVCRQAAEANGAVA